MTEMNMGRVLSRRAVTVMAAVTLLCVARDASAQQQQQQRSVADTTRNATTRREYPPPLGAPYTAEAVVVQTPAGHTLAGTLTIPQGASRTSPVPAIVTITGSGVQDRDEMLPTPPGYRPFRQIADS